MNKIIGTNHFIEQTFIINDFRMLFDDSKYSGFAYNISSDSADYISFEVKGTYLISIADYLGAFKRLIIDMEANHKVEILDKKGLVLDVLMSVTSNIQAYCESIDNTFMETESEAFKKQLMLKAIDSVNAICLNVSNFIELL